MGINGRKRLLYIINSSNYFLSHRSSIALRAKEKGFQIHVASPKDEVSKKLEKNGFIHHDIFLSRSGTKIFGEIRTFLSIYETVKKINPDLVHLITIKPVIYGGIVSSFLKVRGVI